MDDLEQIIKRYQNDVVFHNLVETLVQTVESGRLNRSDFFDAIRLSDSIVFQHQMELSDKWHDRM